MARLDSSEKVEIMRIAHKLADAARAAILPHFRSSALTSENKLESGFDPVTVADRAAEQAMRDILLSERPNDGILGEEFGSTNGSSGLTWVLDPIDGTRGFISGTPTWGVLIALSDETGPVFGMIDQPYIGERFWGGFGHSICDGPLGQSDTKTRNCNNLADAILFTTFPEVGSTAEGAAFAQVSDAVKLTRFGMDCYAYALVAAGQVDLVIEACLNPYDIHAPIAVIQAAGGIVTNWAGEPAHDGGRALAAATPELHAQALKVLQSMGTWDD